ncbi:MAG: DegT/DnrJ/EryC1/StrS family aminotransferase [Candidatus Sumerlaeota bacterium]|nr:DegT/DnrJ/EryC1/StrS family aminotransferase [Candidatus Sumerlaeota bacterium]
MLLGSFPRFRTYSRVGTYGRVAGEALLLRTASGDDLQRFEEAVKARTGARFALCMPQARVGIYLAIKALIQPGRKVILSPYTIYDVVNMVICAGGVPLFADVDRETCNVDPRAVLDLLDGQTGAVFVTHLHGLAMDLEELAAACRARNVPLIEDAAQAFGARVRGRWAGTIGDAGIYSFGLYKNINAFYGGMVVTPRQDLRDRLAREMAQAPIQPLWPLLRKVGYGLFTEALTWPPVFRTTAFHVFRQAYLHDIEWLNRRVREENNPQAKQQLPAYYLRRMRPVQARLALQGLDRVEPDFQTRLGFARLYHQGLSDIGDLILPPFREDGSHVYIQYPAQCADRKALVKHMMRRGCDVAVQHMRNCADLDCFAAYRRECPNARDTARQVFILPTYAKYRQRDVERNIDAIRSFFKR